MRKLIYVMVALFLLGCQNESINYEPIGLKSDSEILERNINTRDMIYSPTIDGTIAEQLSSMVVTDSHPNPNTIKWEVNPNQTFHVVIQRENGNWLLQTYRTGNTGLYLGGYIVNRDRGDGNIYIVKGELYYLYFPQYDVQVPVIF